MMKPIWEPLDFMLFRRFEELREKYPEVEVQFSTECSLA